MTTTTHYYMGHPYEVEAEPQEPQPVMWRFKNRDDHHWTPTPEHPGGAWDCVEPLYEKSALDTLIAENARLRRERDEARDRLKPEDVEWVVNDIAELGVKVGDQFFFLYKGKSLVYGHLNPDPTTPPVHGDESVFPAGTPMRWRHVHKREFGECAHPINDADPSRIGTVSVDDGGDWQPIPAAKRTAPPPPAQPVIDDASRERVARAMCAADRPGGNKAEVYSSLAWWYLRMADAAIAALLGPQDGEVG